MSPTPGPAPELTPRETIGVDLGGTKVLVGVVDERQRVLHESRERSSDLQQERLLDELAEEVAGALAARPDAAAAGLGIPCTIDRERGVAISAVNLPIENLPLRDLMRERLDVPVFLDNDANCAALAEFLFGAGRGSRNLVLLTLGTGIGGGLILDGSVYRGSTGAGAELGHVTIDIDGPPCQGSCPGRGHLETLASGTALAREGRAAAEREPDSALGRAVADGSFDGGRTVTEAARGGDEAARRVMDGVGRKLGIGLASFANVFDPDVLVIAGGVAEGAGDLLLEPAREEVRRHALRPMNEAPVRLAELGADAGMIGAAAMASMELDATG